MRRWWEELYDDWLADTVLAEGASRAPATVAYLVGALGLRPGDRVLDQCCGVGRLAVPLALRGFVVIGIDQAAAYITRARREARRAGAALELHCADALSFVPPSPVAAGFNWWTSFGYAGDAENLLMLRRAGEALARGGRFALETMHRDTLLRDFVPRSVREFGAVRLIRESAIENGSLAQRWTFCLDDREIVRHSRVRLYGPDELCDLFRAAGFCGVEIDLATDPARCVVVGRRAG